ncbi:hypothetical protein Bbelb_137350 [Branchiostoma belcheri]|nr:hypothetical protein Bbelb_137350 [Branchiostoma belcheri]
MDLLDSRVLIPAELYVDALKPDSRRDTFYSGKGLLYCTSEIFREALGLGIEPLCSVGIRDWNPGPAAQLPTVRGSGVINGVLGLTCVGDAICTLRVHSFLDYPSPSDEDSSSTVKASAS